MADNSYTSRAEIYFTPEGGQRLLVGEVQKAQFNAKSGDKEVVTNEKDGSRGELGFIDGAAMTEIKFDAAKPKRGHKANFARAMRLHQNVEIGRVSGDERLMYKGRIKELNEDFDIENPAKLSCSITAGAGIPTNA